MTDATNPDENPYPDSDESTTDPPTAEDEESYTCDVCGKTFDEENYENPRQSYASHFNTAAHKEASPETARPSGGVAARALSLGRFLPTLSDREPETGYTGWLSTPMEKAVIAFGVLLGSLLAHGVVSVEVLATLGGLGLAVSGTAARRRSSSTQATRDAIQSNIEHYVVGIIIGFGVVYLPHNVLPPGWTVDTLLHQVGQHTHAARNTTTTTTAALLALVSR